MSKNTTEKNTFVLEYQGDVTSVEAAFDHLIETISETSPEITGFRLELNTTDPFDGSFKLDSQARTSAVTGQESVDGKSENETSTEDGSTESTKVPSLRSDALPSQVLSLLSDDEEGGSRSSEIQGEFDDENIDTARISQTLASLKRRGLVAAKPDPEDNRANIYWATEKGEQALRN